MATTKMAVVAIMAALLLMAVVESASATGFSPSKSNQLGARKLLACIPAGGWCYPNPSGCCGNCGCLFPAGLCYGSC
ncbi:unnamed protein product [Urochloa decumbens]|uniref:DUF5637 domain-containing protein n=1 Tax=Urochloa decumbens TaxID=240449 RepID=A0ABC8Y8L4_9POAL